MHNEESRGEIYVVDDDPVVREVLTILLSKEGYEVVCFADGSLLMAAVRRRPPAAILLDLHLPGKSGLEILKDLRADDCAAPILMISGQGEIATAVEAVKNGALDFIEKPFRGSDIVARIADAIAAGMTRQSGTEGLGRFQGRDLLTGRELEVLKLCVSGATSKQVGRSLGISPRTVEDHRANIMRKLGVRNAADLVRFVMSALAA